MLGRRTTAKTNPLALALGLVALALALALARRRHTSSAHPTTNKPASQAAPPLGPASQGAWAASQGTRGAPEKARVTSRVWGSDRPPTGPTAATRPHRPRIGFRQASKTPGPHCKARVGFRQVSLRPFRPCMPAWVQTGL